MSDVHPSCPPDGCDICRAGSAGMSAAWPCAKLVGERVAELNRTLERRDADRTEQLRRLAAEVKALREELATARKGTDQ